MSAARAARPILDYDGAIRQIFEAQLSKLSLSAEQIESQDLDQLKVSLEKINDAIRNPDSFGTFGIKMGGETGSIITMSTSEHHFKVGILPLLLERKGEIIDRIRVLQPEQELSDLREDIASSVEDPQDRDRLIETIDRRFEQQRQARENLAREQAEVEAQRAEVREREQRLKIEIRERRSAIYRSFLERESVASVVGAVLLLALGATLIVGMFTRVAISQLIANAFLLILGYFFGQAKSHDRAERSPETGDS